MTLSRNFPSAYALTTPYRRRRADPPSQRYAEAIVESVPTDLEEL
jgi:hypothetical protein